MHVDPHLGHRRLAPRLEAEVRTFWYVDIGVRCACLYRCGRGVARGVAPPRGDAPPPRGDALRRGESIGRFFLVVLQRLIASRRDLLGVDHALVREVRRVRRTGGARRPRPGGALRVFGRDVHGRSALSSTSSSRPETALWSWWLWGAERRGSASKPPQARHRLPTPPPSRRASASREAPRVRRAVVLRHVGRCSRPSPRRPTSRRRRTTRAARSRTAQTARPAGVAQPVMPTSATLPRANRYRSPFVLRPKVARAQQPPEVRDRRSFPSSSSRGRRSRGSARTSRPPPE